MAVDATEELLRKAEEGAEKDGTEDTEEIVLTDRELAIINGDDPDDLAEDEEDTTLGDGKADVTDDDEGGKDAPEPDQEESWVTDDLRQLAGTYGLQDEDIADFGSGEEFLKAAGMLEKLSLRAAQKQWQDHQAAQQQGNASPTGKVEPAKAVETAKDGAAADLESQIKKLREEGYDESLIAPMEAVAAKLRAFEGSLGQIQPVIETQQQRIIAERQSQVMGSFHDVVDALGGRFGGAEAALTPEQEKNRETLFNAARLVERDIMSRGQTPPSMKVVLQRAELLAFGDEIRKERQEALSKQVRGQSGKRRSVGRTVTKKSSPPGDSDDPVAAIANSPEMIALFKGFEEK